jgi:tRNA nucleotidyltransferase (CCA-adding enzyme)
MLGALCHDLGKPLCTKRRQGRIISPGHSELGIEPTRRFLERMTADRDLIAEVEGYVLHHLRPAEFYRVRDAIGDASIRRLALQINISELVKVARADHFGRTTLDALAEDFPAGEWLLDKARQLEVESEGPKPLLMGRHLLERGWQEGPAMGRLLRLAYEAQLDGEFADLEGAFAWLAGQAKPES